MVENNKTPAINPYAWENIQISRDFQKVVRVASMWILEGLVSQKADFKVHWGSGFFFLLTWILLNSIVSVEDAHLFFYAFLVRFSHKCWALLTVSSLGSVLFVTICLADIFIRRGTDNPYASLNYLGVQSIGWLYLLSPCQLLKCHHIIWSLMNSALHCFGALLWYFFIPFCFLQEVCLWCLPWRKAMSELSTIQPSKYIQIVKNWYITILSQVLMFHCVGQFIHLKSFTQGGKWIW